MNWLGPQLVAICWAITSIWIFVTSIWMWTMALSVDGDN